MSKQVEFGEIDFEAIEYRNEYRHTKAAFAGLTAQALLLLNFPKWFFEGDVWLALLGGAYLSAFALSIAALFIQYRSRVIIAGQGILLKRPLLKDVEITYSEIGEVKVNRIVIRESHASASSAISLSEAKQIWDLERINGLTIRSRDGKKKIVVAQSLENFERFCDDLTERWRSAIDRYLGYAKGTSLRQPERYLNALETLKTQREEAPLKARSPSEIQKVGATKSE
jgi:hypothetical protein